MWGLIKCWQIKYTKKYRAQKMSKVNKIYPCFQPYQVSSQYKQNFAVLMKMLSKTSFFATIPCLYHLHNNSLKNLINNIENEITEYI